MKDFNFLILLKSSIKFDKFNGQGTAPKSASSGVSRGIIK
jgi:hypothetical protein